MATRNWKKNNEFMPKNYDKIFENKRKIERCSLLAKRECKTFEKFRASGAQSYPSDLWAMRKQIFWAR